MKPENTVMLFTLSGSVVSGGSHISEKTAARLVDGDAVTIEAGEGGARVMLMSAPPLHEPVAWYGPIVMNEERELNVALRELEDGEFLKSNTKYL